MICVKKKRLSFFLIVSLPWTKYFSLFKRELTLNHQALVSHIDGLNLIRNIIFRAPLFTGIIKVQYRLSENRVDS